MDNCNPIKLVNKILDTKEVEFLKACVDESPVI
jgi:hypothetical protein